MNSAEVLLQDAQAGDSSALHRLLVAHRNGVYRYGLQVCRTTEDAEDAVQETLWAATRAIRMFRGTSKSIASWLFTIVRNECYRLLEGHRLAPAPLDDAAAPADERPSLDDELEERRRGKLLAGALEALDPLHREVILLRDIRELTAPEAAERLGISVAALKSRLHRARASLRDHVMRASARF
jgi:RNA polymerase sigma-70 factor (ECF subfamily)